MVEKPLLILDLDETLVFATETPLVRAADFRVAEYHVYKRPHLAEFLASVFDAFDVAVWSSASDAYVESVVDHIFPDRGELKFVWGRSKTTRKTFPDADGRVDHYDPRHVEYIKPLKKVQRKGWSLERILIIDDTPRKSMLNYGNAIYCRMFEGGLPDDELLLLLKYLQRIKDQENFRSLEKRGWRDHIVEN